MSLKLTYLDSGVLINAFQGINEVGTRALAVLDDSTRQFAASGFVQLETSPKAVYNKRQAEADFYENFLAPSQFGQRS